jgi:hypothetical protein
MFKKGMTAMDGLYGRREAPCCLEILFPDGGEGVKANRQNTAAPAATKRTLTMAINPDLRLALPFGFAGAEVFTITRGSIKTF